MKFIDLKPQYKIIKSSLNKKLKDVFEHEQYILGPEVTELEAKLIEFTNSKYCLTVSSGTDALLIALLCLDVVPGDEIILSSYSFVSAAEVICLLGATPVFVDVEFSNANIDPNQIESKITKKTKAIIATSLFGCPANFNLINKIAKKNKLIVIEDAAQSFGASYENNKSCNLSDIACTSFFPSKPLGCYGDGGAIFFKNKRFYDKAKKIRVHGQSKRYSHDLIGINGRLDTIQAAILNCKLNIFDNEVKLRQKVAKYYDSKLSDIFKTFKVPLNTRSVYAQYSIIINSRKKFIEKFESENIPYAVHYPKSITSQKAYKKYIKENEEFPISNEISSSILCLPMHPYLLKRDQDKIINCLLSLC